jgi:pyruvate dehydrogenase E2 component (dihydrolipoamide acetyltransferase)
MPTPFIMPKMDMDQEVVTIIKWLKKEGDQIEKGEPVIEVETDKIASEIEAPESGILANILYHEYEEAPVTKVVAYILKEGETAQDLPLSSSKDGPTVKDPAPAAVAVAGAKPAVSATPLAEKVLVELEIAADQVPASSSKLTRKDVESDVEKMRDQVVPRVHVAATPAARYLAEERGFALEGVIGSGPRQRVQAEDILQISNSQVSGPTDAAKELISTSVPMVGKRKLIAERLTTSYQSVPHIYLTVEVDMSHSEAARKRMNAVADKKNQPAVSITAYLIKVVAWALKRHPYLNAVLEGNSIQLLQNVNVGVATALEDGLIVPVIHDADLLPIQLINEKLRYLTGKARNGALTANEVAGGTFTISNLGMFRIKSFTAIINPPQSAILAVGGLVRKPVVIDDLDTTAIRPMLSLTLGADHRVVDGAVAASFLAELVNALETPELMLY